MIEPSLHASDTPAKPSRPLFGAILALLTLSAVGTSPARAQLYDAFIKGEDLWRACTNDPEFAYGFIAGAHDALSFAHEVTGNDLLHICLPPDTRVVDIARSVCDGLEEFSNIRKLLATHAVWSFMMADYSCMAKEKP